MNDPRGSRPGPARWSPRAAFTRLLVPEAHGVFRLPPVTYAIARLVHRFRGLAIRLAALETRWLRRRFEHVDVDRPVYIVGLARAGTSITLEVLSQHPDVATHRYVHIPNPYLPYAWDRFVAALPLAAAAPVERIHRDGLEVTKDSPEALEEPLWTAFFDGLHDESRSSVLGPDLRNEAFEAFYRDHLWKLLVSQDRTRYVAKSNYSCTRMEYLLRLFPAARFLLLVRDPVHHVASILKQHRLFADIGRNDPRTLRATELLGHHEFGDRWRPIHTGDAGPIERVRQLEADGHAVRACAHYWASIYGYIADRLQENRTLARQTRVVRYEELCRAPGETLDGIIAHAELSASRFAAVRARYLDRLHPPDYYAVEFSRRERADIEAITAPVVRRFHGAVGVRGGLRPTGL